MQKILTFFSKNIRVYAIFNGQSFNDMLTNDIVSFEQLGPELNTEMRFGYCTLRSNVFLIICGTQTNNR